MRVELEDARSLSFPDVCACCGEAPEITRLVGETIRRGRQLITRRWQVPYCQRCVEHRELMWPGIHAVLTALTLGLYYIPYALVIRPARRRRAEALRKPGCSDVRGVTYKHDSRFDPATQKLLYFHVFDHASERFARALPGLNSSAGG
jgi:hypothetical protein